MLWVEKLFVDYFEIRFSLNQIMQSVRSWIKVFAFSLFVQYAISYLKPSKIYSSLPATRLTATIIRVEESEANVGIALCSIIEEEYKKKITENGLDGFSFAISGGSMLKV